MPSKYPKIENNSDLVRLSLAINLLPLEPYDANSPSTSAFCLRSHTVTRIPLMKIRKGDDTHKCCDKYLKDKDRQQRFSSHTYPIEPWPPFVANTSCSSCKRSCLKDSYQEPTLTCTECSYDDNIWRKGGVLELVLGVETLKVIATNGSSASIQSQRINSEDQVIGIFPLPRRRTPDFLNELNDFIITHNGSRTDWYINPSHANFQTWEIPLNNSLMESVATYLLDQMLLDTFYLNKRNAKNVPSRKKITAQVWSQNEVVLEEELPFAWVHYPAKKGFIFGFSQDLLSEPKLCSCSKAAISRIFGCVEDLEILNGIRESKNLFPDSIIGHALGTNDLSNLFAESICHACNKQIPKLMSSGYEHGPFTYNWLYWYYKQELTAFEQPKLSKQDGEPRHLSIAKYKQEREELRRLVTTRVKQKFGLEAIGGSSITEIHILSLIKNQLPTVEIIHHYRPKWLLGMEIDIWIPSLAIGIEYQGEQHYRPVEAWGGQSALLDVQARDELKRRLCVENSVKLIELKYSDTITEALIQELLIP